MGAVKMSDINLHIFKKDTDAPYTHRGFLFQYVLTLETWIKHYLNKEDILIYCEVEDDIKTIDIQANKINYKQAKCYSRSFTLNDIEIKKSLYNFFLLYLNSEKTSFNFVCSSKPSIKDDLLNSWMNNSRNLPQEVLANCQKYIHSTISNILKEEFEKKLLKLNKLSRPTDDVKKTYRNIQLVLDQPEIQTSFIEQISWSFMDLNPQESLITLISKTKALLLQVGKVLSIEILFSRLLTEIVIKSTHPDPKLRFLDNKLFNGILKETALEMTSNTDLQLIESINQITNEINNIKENVSIIDDKLDYHFDDYGIQKVYVEYKEYKNSKLREFTEPIFNEEFNLFDIFILPDHNSYEFKGEFRDLEISGIQFLSKRELKEIPITDIFLNEADAVGVKEPIFVHGNPGVGKSTFSKYLFYIFAETKPDIIAIHIDLKRFQFAKDFKSAIKQEIEEFLPSFKLIHLKKFKFQLILDGFDELHLISDGQMDDFLSSLMDFHREYKNVGLALTGRTIVFQEYYQLIPKGSIVVEIKHFSPSMIIEWVTKWSKLKNYNKELSIEIFKMNNTIDVGLLNYDDYSEDVEYYTPKVEEDHLVSLPLFLYLICTMLYEDEDLNIEELNQLHKWQFYKKLMDWTCATSKFNNSFNPFQKHLDLVTLSKYKREFNKNISLSMYQSNKFYITSQDIENRELIPLNLKSSYSGGKNLINSFIVLNYMKVNDDSDVNEIAFEFVHKSFYEYLASEALIDTLLYLATDGEQTEELIAKYYISFSGFKLSNDMLQSFFIPMLESIDQKKLSLIFKNLNSIYNNYVINHNFINENNITFLKEYFFIFPEKQGIKLTLESNVLFSILKLLPPIAKLINVNFKINFSELSSQLREVVQFSQDGFTPEELKFNSIDLQGSVIEYVDLYKLELISSNLSNSNFKYSDLSFSNLGNARLSNVDIKYSNFEGANFDFGVLNYTNISEVNMIDTSFVESNLENVIVYSSNFINTAFDRSNICNSEFFQCDLSDAVLDECTIIDTKMSYVNLSGASIQDSVLNNSDMSNSFLSYSELCNSNLQDSKFISCDFRFADLYGADLRNSDLSNTDLSNADLTNANLENAILSGANLTNSTLSKTNLRGCDLSNCIFNETIIDNVDFSFSVMDSVDLTTSQINNCIFYRTSMRHTRISTQDFSNLSEMKFIDFSFSTISFSNFNSLNLEGSNLSNTKIKSCSFESVNFNASILSATEFNKCKMPLATFRDSKIIGTKFTFCDLFESDFKNTILHNVIFRKVNLLFSNIYERKKNHSFINVRLPFKIPN